MSYRIIPNNLTVRMAYFRAQGTDDAVRRQQAVNRLSSKTRESPKEFRIYHHMHYGEALPTENANGFEVKHC